MRQTRANQKQGQESGRAHKSEEVAIVAPAHTVVQPDTVMVESFHAIIAHSAVVAARRPPDVASFAVFDRDIHRSHVGRSQLDHDPVGSGRAYSQRIGSRIWWWHNMEIPGNNLQEAVNIIRSRESI